MRTSMEAYWHWYTGNLIGEPGLFWRLLGQYGTPERIFKAKEEELLKKFPKNYCVITRLCKKRSEWDFEREAEKLKRKEITFVSCEHPGYPARLRMLSQKPGGLFIRGELPKDGCPSVAIVGARTCSPYGRSIALWFGRELAGAGVQIISGMAAGIDGYGHQGALEGGGKTFGVLGGGVDICYPELQRELYMQLEREGGLLSESPPGIRPMRHLFPLRNRIISGLADLVLIIEAKAKSGSLITADLALEQGKEVFAVPGRISDPLSAGCNRLLQSGAAPCLNPGDILEYLGIKYDKKLIVHKNSEKRLAKKENLVYSCLDSRPRHLEDIMNASRLSVTETMEGLINLELKGLIQGIGNQYYCRKL